MRNASFETERAIKLNLREAVISTDFQSEVYFRKTVTFFSSRPDMHGICCCYIKNKLFCLTWLVLRKSTLLGQKSFVVVTRGFVMYDWFATILHSGLCTFLHTNSLFSEDSIVSKYYFARCFMADLYGKLWSWNNVFLHIVTPQWDD